MGSRRGLPEGTRGDAPEAGWVLGIALCGLALRVLIEAVLWSRGWFFGEEWDPFSRVYLAWKWSEDPFLVSGHWLPLQFWVVGSLYRLLAISTAEFSVPVLVNHACFFVSLVLVCWIATRLGRRRAGIAAVALASTLRTDIWVTFNTFSEPILIMCALFLAAFILEGARASPDEQSGRALLLATAAAIASATHYLGWSLSALAVGLCAVGIVRTVRLPAHHGKSSRMLRYLLGALIAVAFPFLWIALDAFRTGSWFEFLNTAAGFHEIFRPQTTLLQKLMGPIVLWISTAPLLIGASFVGMILVAYLAKSVGLKTIVPGLAYLAFLEVASAASWGVPFLYSRYTTALTWLSIPFAALLVPQLARSGRRWMAIAAGIVLIVGTLDSIRGTFQFSNWVSADTRKTAQTLSAMLSLDNSPAFIVYESFSQARDQALPMVSGSPARFLAVSRSSAPSLSVWRDACRADCLWVVRDFDTLRALESNSVYVFSSGEWVVLRPSISGTLSSAMNEDLNAWVQTQDEMFLVRIPLDRIVFGYAESDPNPGSVAGVQATYRVRVSECRLFSVEVQDLYDVQDTGGRLVQQLLIGGTVVWERDVAGGVAYEWESIERTVHTTGDTVVIMARIVAVGAPEKGWEWGRASRMQIRDPQLLPCPD